jgi:hypothetical protein
MAGKIDQKDTTRDSRLCTAYKNARIAAPFSSTIHNTPLLLILRSIVLAAHRTRETMVGYRSAMAAGTVLCLLVVSSSVQVSMVAAAAGARPPAMFVFGDSTLDVGNNNYLPGPGVPRANQPFYGIDFPGAVATGRFSNGYNIADYLG